MKKLITRFSLVAILALTLISCSKDTETEDSNYSVAENQLKLDYSQYNLTGISWRSVLGYQVANFKFTTKANGTNANAWYLVNNNIAKREKSTASIGVTVPETIKAAFEASKYSNALLWRIDEIELENNYNGNAVESIYEVELESVINTNIEAEMYFDAKTGVLLYSREYLDDDDDNDDDNSIVIDDKLVQAVRAIYPDAVIIDAEIDDNMIEVAVTIIEGGIPKEVEMLFTMDYKYKGGEIEYEVTYGKLSEKFKSVKDWFANTANGVPVPNDDIIVEIEEGVGSENGITYMYQVEVEYTINGTEYNVELFLDAEYVIVIEEIEIDND